MRSYSSWKRSSLGANWVYDEVLSNGRKKRFTPEKMILELLQAEAAERRMRSIRYRMGQATFPVLKDLDQFNFSESCVDEAQIRSPYQGDFLGDHTNLDPLLRNFQQALDISRFE
jgi:hypothetical protein